MKRMLWVLALAAGVACAADDDPVLRALRDEIARSKSVRAGSLEAPYYIEATIADVDQYSVTATGGGLIRATRNRVRAPQVKVRVGDYQFDNTNYIASGFNFGSGYDVERLPLDDRYDVLRRFLWLAIDRAYKSSVETLARKRAALKNMSVAELQPDFARAEPVRLLEPPPAANLDEEAWKGRLRQWSAALGRFAALRNSGVEYEGVRGVNYFVSSEGAETRTNERIHVVRARAMAQAADGEFVWDSVAFEAFDPNRLPPEAEILRGIEELGQRVSALARAPRGETYSGPVMFEGDAAAQLFAHILGKNFALLRRPVMEPGQGGGFPSNDLEGRLGSRILPEWMDVTDDPTQTEWRGRALLGHYVVDLEGVRPVAVSLVEKGVLKNFLSTRQPSRGIPASNGHARMPGAFGANQAGFGNLFVRARETTPSAELKKKLIEAVAARGKPYGLIVRRFDFPSIAGFDQLRRFLGRGGTGVLRPAAPPVAVFRVYPDGREELVRGLRFRGLSVRSLKDIMAAGDTQVHFDFTDSPAPLSLVGGGGFVTLATVVAPPVLIDDLELERIDEELPKLPIVPPPPSGGGP